MGISLDDLISLVKQRGTEVTFPEKEEFFGLLDPFRSVADQESVRLALAATVRKGDRLVARLASEALGYLGGEAGMPLLVAIAMDESLGTSQRASAVWVMDRHLPGFRERLTPEEQFVCMSLPVFEMLEDPEADNGFGLQALLASYRDAPPSVRASLVGAIAHAGREQKHEMASIFMHLLGAEEDDERRRKLLDLAAADLSQKAADLLATFAAKTGDADEAKYARRHLHLLRAKGLRGVAHANLREARALVTGVDGDACFSVNIIIPRVPTFDLANLLFHLETGVRDGFVMHNLPGRSVDEMVEKIKAGCGTICTFVPMPVAARIVDEAMRSSKPAAREDGDVAGAIATAEPALAEARGQPYVEPDPPAKVETTIEEASGLLDGEGFESWFFEAAEDTVQKALEALSKPIASRGKAGEKVAGRRLAKASEDLCRRLRADDEHVRLQRMLRHQARLLECAGDGPRAALCRKLAVEVERPESLFLLNMATRAIIDALEEPSGEERPARFLEARNTLRARMELSDRPPTKSAVALLDMSAAAHTEMVIVNRAAASARRVPLAALEAAALEAGDIVVAAFEKDQRIEQILDDVQRMIERRGLFAAADRHDVASEIVSGVAGLRNTMCGDRCPHRCFDNPRDDGRAAFFAEGAPWHGPDDPPARGGRSKA